MKIPEAGDLYEGDGGFLNGLSPWEQGVLTAASLEGISLGELPFSTDQLGRLRAYEEQLRTLTEDARYVLCLTILSALEVPGDG